MLQVIVQETRRRKLNGVSVPQHGPVYAYAVVAVAERFKARERDPSFCKEDLAEYENRPAKSGLNPGELNHAAVLDRQVGAGG